MLSLLSVAIPRQGPWKLSTFEKPGYKSIQGPLSQEEFKSNTGCQTELPTQLPNTGYEAVCLLLTVECTQKRSLHSPRTGQQAGLKCSNALINLSFRVPSLELQSKVCFPFFGYSLLPNINCHSWPGQTALLKQSAEPPHRAGWHPPHTHKPQLDFKTNSPIYFPNYPESRTRELRLHGTLAYVSDTINTYIQRNTFPGGVSEKDKKYTVLWLQVHR